MKDYKVIVIVFLIGITIFSVFKYISVLKEKQDLATSFKKLEVQLAALEEEKQILSKELTKEKESGQKFAYANTRLKRNLKAGDKRLTRSLTDGKVAQDKIEELNSQNNLMKLENTTLKEEKDKLSQENTTFKAKFNSIEELKKAIRELKIQMRNARWHSGQKAKSEIVIEGNRGYIIKGGKPTYTSTVKIEVTPVPGAGVPAP